MSNFGMELWHVVNRGVDKRAIVQDDSDRLRFIHDLFAFNDENIVTHMTQPERRSGMLQYKREVLIHVHAYCLMDNHYHLLVSEVVENGLSRYMQKLNMGYTKYFNERYSRTGTLWQGKYKKVRIERDSHFMYVPFYIHLNPLDFKIPEWRQGKVQDTKAALAYLRTYRWSSHLDYVGVKNFPSLIQKEMVQDIIGSPTSYEKEIIRLIAAGENDIPRLTLE